VSPSGSALRDQVDRAVLRTAGSLPPAVLRVLSGSTVVVDGQELHPEVRLALRLLELGGEPAYEKLSVAEARNEVEREATLFGGPPVPVGEVRDIQVPGPGGDLRTRFYRPPAASGPAGAPVALLVYFHGGGWVVGSVDSHDNTCRFLCRHAGVAVLSVDYRRAPDDKFPAAVDDALAAFRWAAGHAGELGVAPGAIAVGGDSAGGNLAAVVSQLACRDGGPRPAFQLLFVPVTDLSAKSRSYELFREGFYLTEATMDWYRDHYLPDAEAALDPRASPLLADDVGGLPPAYVATAGFDPLRDEGEAYAARLRDAGVPVALRRHSGLVHAFANAIGVGHTGRDAMLEAAGALSVGLALPRP